MTNALSSWLSRSALAVLACAGVACGTPPGPGGGDAGVHLQSFEVAGSTLVTSPRFSPDGNTVAFVQWASGDQDNVGVMPATGGTPRFLTNAGTYLAAVAWSPSGDSLYYTSDQGLRQIPIQGGASTQVTDCFACMDPDVGPGGTRIVYGINGSYLELFTFGSPSLPPQALAVKGNSPRFSPDGKRIAFQTGNMIELYTVDTQEVTVVLDAKTYLASVDWFSDGKRLVISSDKGIEIVDISSTEPVRTLVKDDFAATDVDLSPDEKKIAYTVNGLTAVFVLTGF